MLLKHLYTRKLQEANAAKSDGVREDCGKQMHVKCRWEDCGMMLKATICDDSCHKQPCARRLRKGQELPRKLCAGRKRKLCQSSQLWRGECCRKRPCVKDRKQGERRQKSDRVRRKLYARRPQKGECYRKRPCAKDYERRTPAKQLCATKAATSSRVPDDCEMRLLPKATVCERQETAKGREL